MGQNRFIWHIYLRHYMAEHRSPIAPKAFRVEHIPNKKYQQERINNDNDLNPSLRYGFGFAYAHILHVSINDKSASIQAKRQPPHNIHQRIHDFGRSDAKQR